LEAYFQLQDGLFLHFVTATQACPARRMSPRAVRVRAVADTAMAMQAGFIAAFVANPFDVVKSRVMNAKGGAAVQQGARARRWARG
jgi:hypothetical protein